MRRQTFKPKVKSRMKFRNREEVRGLTLAEFNLYCTDPEHLCIFMIAGLGGIGKTRLIEQIHKDISKNIVNQKVIRVQVNLESESTNSIAGPLKVIRDQIPFDCLLFDCAILAYWSATGQPFQLSPTGSLSDSLITKGVEQGMSVGGYCLPIKFAVESFVAFRKKRLKLKNYQKSEFEEIDDLRSAPAKLLCELPRLLGIDINRNINNKQRFLFLYDSYEKQSRKTLKSSSLWLQEFIDNINFGVHIITSREIVHWKENDWRGYIKYAVLDKLSNEDCFYIINDLLGDVENEIVQKIVIESKGIPFFLQAYIENYISLSSSQKTVELNDLPCTKEKATESLLSHLNEDERLILMSIACLRFFDDFLFASVLREFNIPAFSFSYEEFKSNFFVESFDEENGVFKIHSILSHFILSHFDMCTIRHKAVLAGCQSLDNRTAAFLEKTAPQSLLPFFFSLFSSCKKLDNIDSNIIAKLIDIGYRFYDIGLWQELSEVFGKPRRSIDNIIDAIECFFYSISLRRLNSISTALKYLKLIEPYERLFGKHILSIKQERAYLKELQGDSIGARNTFSQLYDQCQPFQPFNRVHFKSWLYHSDILIMDGNFLGGALILADAIEMIQPVDSTQMQNKIELIRHRGHAFRFSYLFEDAERLYLKALSMSKKGSSIYGKLLSNLAETRCWYNFEQAINDSNLALEENSKLNNLIEIGKNHTSLAIALCGLGKFEKSIEHLTEAERIFDSVGYLSGKLFVTIPKFIIAVKKGLEHESAQVYNEARLIVRQLKTYDHLLILYSKIIEDSKTFNQIFKQTSWLNVKRAKKTLIQIIHKFSLDNIGKA